ncbi:MAG: hypothetical protein Q9214_001983 [Letrouitia sp. 1 TL-2023]
MGLPPSPKIKAAETMGAPPASLESPATAKIAKWLEDLSGTSVAIAIGNRQRRVSFALELPRRSTIEPKDTYTVRERSSSGPAKVPTIDSKSEKRSPMQFAMPKREILSPDRPVLKLSIPDVELADDANIFELSEASSSSAKVNSNTCTPIYTPAHANKLPMLGVHHLQKLCGRRTLVPELLPSLGGSPRPELVIEEATAHSETPYASAQVKNKTIDAKSDNRKLLLFEGNSSAEKGDSEEGDWSVGCLGGWMQGGGHGPAVHDYGLGADQVLEAQVVLADGRTVTANQCQQSDLFFAIRGGGGSTYGVVISTTVKAHPTVRVAAQQLSFAPLKLTYTPDFMKALEIVYNAYPALSDKGYSGYGSWSIASPTPLVYNYNYTIGGEIAANFTTGFTHTIAAFGKSSLEAQAVFAPVTAKLSSFAKTLFINITYSSFPAYSDYYTALSGIEPSVGISPVLGSRLLDRNALTSPKLGETLKTIAGTPEQFTSNNVVFVGGGQVSKGASDPYSGVNPAWRNSYVHNIVARGLPPGADEATKEAVYKDVTNVKVRAMKNLAPNTGAYMNEATSRLINANREIASIPTTSKIFTASTNQDYQQSRPSTTLWASFTAPLALEATGGILTHPESCVQGVENDTLEDDISNNKKTDIFKEQPI